MTDLIAPLSDCGATDLMSSCSSTLGNPAREQERGHNTPDGHESLGVLEFPGQIQV